MPSKNYISLCHYDLLAADGTLLHQHLHLEFQEGEALLIKGSNGSGKTTLVNVLRQMLSKNKLKVELLPQLMNLKCSLPLSLGEILDLVGNEKQKKKILELGILEEHHLLLDWNTASGGEKRRVLLARSLMMEPEILILDEPFNHLDSQSVEKISESLSRMMKNKVLKGLIVVSHPVYFKHPSFEGVGINEVSL